MVDHLDPYGRVMTLPQLVDEMLDEMALTPRATRSGSAAIPPVNLYEEGNRLVVEAELPGVKPEGVDVTVEGATLTIRADAGADEERTGRTYLVREHRRRAFLRSVPLPTAVDADQARAAFDNGLLRITFTKFEEATQRHIPVAYGAGRQEPANAPQRHRVGAQT